MFHLLFWTIAFLFYQFLSEDNQIFSIFSGFSNINSVYFGLALLSIFTSFYFTLIDLLFTDRIMRFFPIHLVMLVKSFFYLLFAFSIVLLTLNISLADFNSVNYLQVIKMLPEISIHYIQFLVYFFVAGFFNSFFKGMMKKVGRGNFRNWVFGMFNKPREEERIFMFIDLKASTTIAEKLEHKKFSHLVQDVFNDMAVVDNYQGEIYQYLGDGAIISWNLKDGLKRNNCLNAFFAFTRVLEKRSRYYDRKYGEIPKFKAGMHVGKVMVLQVGQIRRDISYNGDTLNTAARIESMCNEYKKNLLISGELYNKIANDNGFKFNNIGEILLKGKKRKVDIYSVK